MNIKTKSFNRVLPRVSILICTLNGHDSLSKTLPILLDAVSGMLEFEILIVDDGSNEETRDFLRRQNVHIRVVTHHKNLGRGAARQTALEAAVGEYVAYVDDDIIVSKVWARNLVGAMSNFNSPEIKGIGGPCEIQADKTLTNLYLKFRNPFSLYGKLNPGLLNRIRRLLSAQKIPSEIRTVENLLGGNMLFRKSDLIEVGGFNVNLRHGEDDDICSRMKLRFGPASLIGLKALAVEHLVDETEFSFLERQFRYAKSSGAKFRSKPGIPSLNVAVITFLASLFYDALVLICQAPEFLLFSFFIPFFTTPGWFSFAKRTKNIKKFLLPFLSWVVGVFTFTGFIGGLLEAREA